MSTTPSLDITIYIPICEAMVLLMSPLMEIVIHDLETGTICFIAGEISGRQVGDPSLLDKTSVESDILDLEKIDNPMEQIIYPKLNVDGRLIRSISIPLREQNEIKALLCINCDISIFQQMKIIGQRFIGLSSPNSQPQSLFKDDWQERLNIAIHDYLKEVGWSLETLSNSKKKQLAQHLYETGAFREKKAADYVATALKLGRATIFNYLREWRTK